MDKINSDQIGNEAGTIAEKCIGIICGDGDYPKIVARACIEQNLNFCMLMINAFADNCVDIDSSSKNCRGILNVKIGEIGSSIDFFHRNNVTNIVFAGGIKRPNFSGLSLDKKGRSWLLKLGKSVFYGDDALLKAIAKLLNEEGFVVISGTEILKDVFVSSGIFSNKHPTEAELFDIKIGFNAAKNLGSLDIGQSVIVHDGLILGVECVEGTDALIERCAKLRKSASGGVLIKTSKPQQDHRLDLPTVGINTINQLNINGFSGLIIESEKCIVINKKLVIEQVNDFSMFFGGGESGVIYQK